MKRANSILTGIMVGNIVMFIISLASVISGISVMASSSKILNSGSDLLFGSMAENMVDGWGVLGGLAGLVGGVAIAVLGMIFVFFGVVFGAMYLAAMINSIITKVGYKKTYVLDIEACRKKMMTTGIVSTVINSIILLTVFLMMLGTGTIVYVLLSLMCLIGATLTFSIMEIIVTQKMRWYAISTANNQMYEDVETKRVD